MSAWIQKCDWKEPDGGVVRGWFSWGGRGCGLICGNYAGRGGRRRNDNNDVINNKIQELYKPVVMHVHVYCLIF